MILLPLLLFLSQRPVERLLLETEHARAEDVSPLLSALQSPDPKLQRLATRSMGRLERPSLAHHIVPFLRSDSAEVRLEAVVALARMGASFDFPMLISSEKNAAIRAAVYEAIGRAKAINPESEAALVAGLRDDDPQARTGAARGLEAMVRLNIRTTRPQPATLAALRQSVQNNRLPRLRQFALLALNAAGDQDAPTFDAALRDEDPQVRRLAVIGSKQWLDDPSPMVRFEAIRFAPDCARALAAVEDLDGHVMLAAVDALGALKCEGSALEALADRGKNWRIRARALLSLAKVAPEAARGRLAVFAADPVWQARVYAARAARLVNDEPTLARLSRDVNPNVAGAAMTTVAQAATALASDHSGLLLNAATMLKGAPELRTLAPRVLEAVLRLTGTGRATARDPRVRLIELLGVAGDLTVVEKLRPLLADRDPAVAAAAARVLTDATGKKTEARTARYVPEPLPSEATLRSLEGATAVVTMKDIGAFTLELFPEEAPASVATFAALAEKGRYDGLTFHRVVPNFVLQGGSPGANEYDALTPQFMRDEVGALSHERGTLGISTRGHDTGDGQIFINLVDNFRLDHTYTVFARVTSGMDIVDRILEGAVMEKIEIRKVRFEPRPFRSRLVRARR